MNTMLIVDKHCSDICCMWRIYGATNWSQKQITKRTVTQKILLTISMGKDTLFLSTENIKIYGQSI